MANEDTLRLILQNAYNRKENLVQINTQATLAIPTIIVAIWGIEGGLNNFRNLWILSLISIGLLLIWRYFAHYIDNDIATIYIEIVKTENRLNVPDDLSLFNNFIRSLTKNQTELHIDDGAKLKLLEYLNKNKLMGYRGHDKWDKVALILIYLFSVASIAAIFQSAFKTIHIFLPHYLLALILILKIVFFGFALFVGLVLTGIIIIIFRMIVPIQKDPDPYKLKKLCPSLFDEKKTD